MIRKPLAVLLAAAALSAPGFAQPAGAPQLSTREDTVSRIEALQAQIEALKVQVETLKNSVAASAPQWVGAPQFKGDGGWSFKLRGFAQLDAGAVENPNGAIATKALGFNSRARRIVFGAEGTMPGGFGYKAELDFGGSNGQVGFEDVVLIYAPAGRPLQLTAGNFFPLSSLETMTSSRVASFLERAAFTDAFNHGRRLGIAAAYLDPDGLFALTAGVWTKPIDGNFTFGNNQWQASVRGTASPRIGDITLHLGATYQHRRFSSDGLNTRYRARPFTQITDVRFVDTGALAARNDSVVGLEAAAIFKSVHVAAEGQRVKLDSYAPGTVFTGGDTAAGAVFTNGNPAFKSWYAEAGWFITGESRGYAAGRWDRTKVLAPFDKGGWGAIQLVGRYDYLDLTHRVSTAAAPASLTNFAAPNRVSGGIQKAIQLGLNWQPIDYVRVMANYTHDKVEGGPAAGAINGVAAGPLAQASDYDVDIFAMRAQIEF